MAQSLLPEKHKKSNSLEWVTTARQLQRRSTLMQRTTMSSLMRTNGDLVDDARPIVEEGEEAEKKRKSEGRTMFSVVRKTRELVDQLRYTVENPTDESDYMALVKKLAKEVENSLVLFKRKQRSEYESMEKQSSELFQELSAVEQRICEFDGEITSASQAASRSQGVSRSQRISLAQIGSPDEGQGRHRNSNNRPVQSIREGSQTDGSGSLKEQIERLQELIDSEGGTTGFWDTRDHDHFLKLLARIPTNRTMLCQRASREIPNQSPESVDDHFEWYRRYVRYTERKRQIVVEWRKSKQKKSTRSFSAAEGEEEGEIEPLAQHNAERAEARRQRVEEQRAQKKEAVKKWKEERVAREQSLEKAHEQRVEEDSIRLKEEARRKKVERTRILKKFRDQREIERLVRDRNQKKVVEKDVVNERKRLKEMRKRDAEIVSRRQIRIKEKENIERQKQKKLKNLAEASRPIIKVKRDFARLTCSTSAARTREQITALSKEASAPGEGGPGFGGAGPRVRRAVPSWRKGV
eukprot:253236_1